MTGAPMTATLSPRQVEVLALAADGLSTNEIASRLGISRATTSHHFTEGRERLGACDRAHAVALAGRAGILDLAPMSVGSSSSTAAGIAWTVRR